MPAPDGCHCPHFLRLGQNSTEVFQGLHRAVRLSGGYLVTSTRQADLVARSTASPRVRVAGRAGGAWKRGWARSALIAQETPWGKMPGSRRRRMMAAPELTTPTVEPSTATTGPPAVPGWSGMVIWRKAVSVSGPPTALNEPSENLGAASAVVAVGNPTVKTGSPGSRARVPCSVRYAGAVSEVLSAARSLARAPLARLAGAGS